LGVPATRAATHFPWSTAFWIDSSRVQKPSAALGESTQSPIAEMAGSEVCKCAS